MFRNYFITAIRNLRKNKAHSFINIAGLSVGMAVAILIGLWIWDELSFNKYHHNYDRIAQVMVQQTFNNSIDVGAAIPLPLDGELRNRYGSNFKHLALSSWNESHIFTVGDKKISNAGVFMGAEAPEMFSLNMIRGNRNALGSRSSMMISQSLATALFGATDPINKTINLDNKDNFTISGVYEDLPINTSLYNTNFIGPWDYYISQNGNIRSLTDWGDNSLLLYAEVPDHVTMESVSGKIRNAILNNAAKQDAKFKPLVFLQPMSQWHLYSEFKNGVNTGGAIRYVWLFGIIGMFVLFLACINFMNLSTARSEKRAKEVGLRKAIGSLRSQLIFQFFCESVLMAFLAFIFSLLIVSLVLPFFNEVANKKMSLPWTNPSFWIISAGFTLLTGIIAGSYPALYLSSFNPVKVLKGTYKAGRLAAIPRKVLVVLQFTVSVSLIIGTIMVFKQIQFGKNRPIGYNRDGLLVVEPATDDLHNHFDAVRNDLLKSGAVTEVSESSSSTTGLNNNRGDIEWKGKDPTMAVEFGNVHITTEYGKSVGWQFAEGRDFSAQLVSDSSALVINEAAVRYMGLKNPVGETIRVRRKDFTVIGVIKNMVMQSPYEPAKQTIFYLSNQGFGYINIRINPATNAHDALAKIEAVYKNYSPSVPFAYKFASSEYAKKFSNEERIGTLAGFFSILAIFISCLGLFGMASFMAEQRVKEIGVRKILGASVFNLWGQLSRDFIVLVLISLLIAVPLSWYFMSKWLMNYAYHSDMPWWVFVLSGAGAIVITILTVSYQGIKAALANPVNSLRAE